jgi:hypothetical protein
MTDERKAEIANLREQIQEVERQREQLHHEKYTLERHLQRLQKQERDEAYELQRALDKSPEAVMLKAEREALRLQEQQLLDTNPEYQRLVRLRKENREKIWELERRIRIPEVIELGEEES